MSLVQRRVLVSAASLLAIGLMTLSGSPFVAGSAARADIPPSPVASTFVAAACAGTTAFDPTVNAGGAIENLLQVFGARLASYNAGNVVPLYDAYGGSVLLDAAGNVHSGSVAYPPLCGTRYVAAAGGPVSEWMFCTDLESQSCGDVDSNGNIVDRDGHVIDPMTSLTGNSRLSGQQQKIIAYLIRHGHGLCRCRQPDVGRGHGSTLRRRNQ